MVANDQNSDEEVDAAWLWMEYLSTPDIMAEWTYGSPDGTNLPPLTSLLEGDDLIEQKPILEGFAKLMDCGVASTVSNPKAPQVEEALNEELAKAIHGLPELRRGARQRGRQGEGHPRRLARQRAVADDPGRGARVVARAGRD